MTPKERETLEYMLSLESRRTCVDGEKVAALRAALYRPAPPDDLALRHAWEAGFRLCRSYGDNHHHFDGEQKERRWRDYANGLAAPAPVAAPAPETWEKVILTGETLAGTDMATVLHALKAGAAREGQ